MTQTPTNPEQDTLGWQIVQKHAPFFKPEELATAINNALEKEALKARIDTYQRLILWLENQEDNDKLALLGKDISVELDDLFQQLKQLGSK